MTEQTHLTSLQRTLGSGTSHMKVFHVYLTGKVPTMPRPWAVLDHSGLVFVVLQTQCLEMHPIYALHFLIKMAFRKLLVTCGVYLLTIGQARYHYQ